MRALLTYGTFPGVLSAALLTCWALLGAGVDGSLALTIPAVSAALVVIALEKLHPYRAVWNEPRGDVGLDLVHMLFSTVLVPEVFKFAALGALVAGASWLSATIGSPLWPTNWPMAAQVGLAMVIGEFGPYWEHRLMHEKEVLWRLHSVHHSAPRLYWLNAGRFHPLDNLLGFAAATTPLVLMGAPEAVIVYFTLVTSVHGIFQHCNIDIRLGPLNWVFSMAELHRWHHAASEEGNCNYGANLIVWDIVFGSRFLPADREPPEDIGLMGHPSYPNTYLGHLAVPFRYHAMVGSGVDQHSDTVDEG
jgi:sterol desaturase/sphingolipid hydroxylase (fatty acid hydroxylase superfamily)